MDTRPVNLEARQRYSLSDVLPREQWWVDHQPWLESIGYMLRPRFKAGWQPSWHNSKVEVLYAEDKFPATHPDLLDATRLSDGLSVMLKRVDKTCHPTEVEITTLLSSPPLASDPRNHCIPLFDVLQVPDDANMRLMVLPLLRAYDKPRFDTVGEVVDCLRQVIEGVQFLHAQKIAHRDIHLLNIMMNGDPLYAMPFHPVDKDMRRDWKGSLYPSYTRTQRPVKYHIIDFGLSIQYATLDPPPSEFPILGGDKSVPEFVGDDPTKHLGGLSKPYNPFPADVYCVGNWICDDFLVGSLSSKRLGLDFLWPLVDEMTQDDPSERPTMDQALAMFESIVARLSAWKLRSRVAKVEDNPFYDLHLSVTHWMRRVKLVALRRPAVPSVAN